MSDKTLNTILGVMEDEPETIKIEVVDESQNLPAVIKPVDEEKDIEEDFELVRTNIKSTIDKADSVIDEMMAVAKQSQHPRAYEVLGNLMKMSIDANKDLLEVRKKKNDLTGVGKEGPTTINNNLVMSTHEVMKLINEKRKRDNPEEDEIVEE